MAIDFSVDPVKRLVSVQVRGVLTRNEVMLTATQIREHPDFDFCFSELLDLVMLESSQLKNPDLLVISDRYDPFSRRSKRAFVTGQGETAHELARTYRIIRESACIEIFSTRAEALRWLETEGLEASSQF
jgi:hypothetical protein